MGTRTADVPNASLAAAPDRLLHVGAGVGLFIAVAALYGSTMPHSFVAGDSANYLNLAHTGSLTDRGNGVPLYITMLNAAVRVSLPFALADGLRANLLTVLMAASAITLVYAACLRAGRNIVAALFAAVGVTVSGLIWESAAWIMPHVGMVVLGALFVLLMVQYDRAPSSRTSFGLGLACGLGFGLLPDALLYAPVALGFILLRRRGRAGWTDTSRVALGLGLGIAVNALLIAAHEAGSPTFATDGRSVIDSTLFYLRGGQETNWLLGNVSVGHAVRGFFTLPMEIGADLEFFGSALALVGLIVGLRTAPLLHLSLIAAFAILSMWSGVYPGDTRLMHGLGAYPIAGFWLAHGAQAAMDQGRPWSGAIGRWSRWPALRGLGWGALLVFLLFGNFAAGKLLYRERLCDTRLWFLAGYCRERIPESVGDLHLRRAKAAIDQIPEGSLVFGAAWDATDQMKYLIEVRRTRPDLGTALDVTKLSPEGFAARLDSAWERGRRVYLYGEWHDLELWSPEHLSYFRATPRGELIFELFATNATQGISAAELSP